MLCSTIELDLNNQLSNTLNEWNKLNECNLTNVQSNNTMEMTSQVTSVLT